MTQQTISSNLAHLDDESFYLGGKYAYFRPVRDIKDLVSGIRWLSQTA